jgi:hypothetical protein
MRLRWRHETARDWCNFSRATPSLRHANRVTSRKHHPWQNVTYLSREIVQTTGASSDIDARGAREVKRAGWPHMLPVKLPTVTAPIGSSRLFSLVRLEVFAELLRNVHHVGCRRVTQLGIDPFQKVAVAESATNMWR